MLKIYYNDILPHLLQLFRIETIITRNTIINYFVINKEQLHLKIKKAILETNNLSINFSLQQLLIYSNKSIDVKYSQIINK